MNSSEYSQIIQFAAGIGLLFFGYTFMYVRTRLDNFREDLFSLRDDLFDYMWKNEIPYSMPAYKTLRDALNSNIRFCLWSTPVFFSEVLKEIEEIPDPIIRNHYRFIYRIMMYRIFDFMFIEGPLWSIAKLILWEMR